MKVLVSWLRELVEVPVGIDALAERLHMAGFELAGIEPVAADGPPDAIIDLEITANRPDCLSMAGIAREVSAIFGGPLRYRPATFPAPGHPDSVGPLRVTIEAPDLCRRFTAALADVTVGASPGWLSRRLHAAGIRSISNIVDITNYVLLEMGQPVHAYDLARLAGPHLHARRAEAGEKTTTLDGQQRTLTADVLIIADDERSQGLAGVMGGADSEVSGATTTIAIECAYFNPGSVRRTSRRLGLSTEASYRFERGADPEGPPAALARVCALIEQIGAGRVRPGWIDAHPVQRPRARLVLRESRVNRVLGYHVPADRIEEMLRALGFGVHRVSPPHAGEPPAWNVEVPSWRVDVAREVDLIEEIARIHGYERIPETFPALEMAPPRPDPRLARDAYLRTLARGAGFSESVTFSFIERNAALAFVDAGSIVAIANPLSESYTVMRPTLLAGLADSVAHNCNREQRDVRLFELATRFTRADGERRVLALAWAGQASGVHWSGSGRPADLYDMIGAVDSLCAAVNLEARFVPADVPFLTPESATAVEIDRREDAPVRLGVIGRLAPAVAAAHGIPARDDVFVAEIDLDAADGAVELGERIRVSPLPRFPSSARDISILLPDGLPAGAVRDTIRRAAPPTLERVQEFDRYRGKGVPEGRCSLSIRLTFRAPDRTLTDAEVQGAMDAVLAALQAEHGAVLRM